MNNHEHRSRRAFFQRLLRSDDDGVAIITVTLVGVAVAGIVAVLAINTVRNYRESREERQVGEVLLLAEAGLDEAIFELNQDNTYSTVGAMPGALDAAGEEAWVRSQAAGMATIPGENGEYVIIKPEGSDVVYSVAYTPAREVPSAQVQVLKADLYLEPPTPGSPYLPSRGFSSAGNLTIGNSGSAGVYGTAGGVHANGILSQGGSATVLGCATAYGPNDFAASNPPGCGPATGYFEPIPEVEPLLFHSLSMFDLCVEGGVGVVRAGPAHSDPAKQGANGLPCSGEKVGSPGDVGWQLKPAGWSYQGGAGVFFVNGGQVGIDRDSGTGVNGATIITAASNEATLTCNTATRVGNVADGDIEIAGGVQLTPHPSAGDLALVAGRDIRARGNANVWGALLAREQIGLGGTPGANNALIGSSPCHTPGSPIARNEFSGDASITYNGGLSIPNYGVLNPVWNVSIDRWSEL
ncbi:MAG: hypothetical protein HKO63_07230 [Acidimicrobiia bacterium]|nr:hypothetical protein [Acidimicrobiia bacterium]MBT8192236.1 hypothetical protein [Acidimicrobiia bacterium]MBT8246357.1 hypothetical protein [Acidimicrobiia bacterium]NNF88562.1 hypothetical protein [Acidimicrobiia bacterium]NNJ47100.1 hypothetical protein [Acidimicrobiia bacterium]